MKTISLKIAEGLKNGWIILFLSSARGESKAVNLVEILRLGKGVELGVGLLVQQRGITQ